MAIEEITVKELAALTATATSEGGVALVDVREDDEWLDGHVPWAKHVPLGGVPDHLDAFGADAAHEPTYVICRSGGRSLRACEFAVAHGKNVVNVTGGMLAWVDAGHAVETGR